MKSIMKKAGCRKELRWKKKTINIGWVGDGGCVVRVREQELAGRVSAAEIETQTKLKAKYREMIERRASEDGGNVKRELGHVTISAALKLLLRRLTLLSPGRSPFDPGTTTALELFFIHASLSPPSFPFPSFPPKPLTPSFDAPPFAAAAAAADPRVTTPTPGAVFALRPVAASVGSLLGVIPGPVAACSRERVPRDVVLRAGGWGLAGLRVMRGILFGLGPFEEPFVGEEGTAEGTDEEAACVEVNVPCVPGRRGWLVEDAATERVTRAGRCSEHTCVLRVEPLGGMEGCALTTLPRVAADACEVVSGGSASSSSSDP